jgi:hypothetical protein
LPQIIDARRPAPALFAIRKRRDQQSAENCDNGDDHQQLDERKTCRSFAVTNANSGKSGHALSLS